MMDVKQEKNWAIACHAASLAWIPLSLIGIGAIPFLNIIAPAVIWYLKKDESKLIDEHGKESTNFQISMAIYGVVAGIAFMVLIGIFIFFLLIVGATEGNFFAVLLSFVTGFGFILAVGLMLAIAIFQVIVVINAAMKAKNGEMYRYPFNLRLL
ncbi:DUF4870 domain-containing protein [[Limnothrix rosea] IAM M-220]|uniref:DUF4870 domain-containing protein n=1 Tax=[Limnothrix rosea] IAM M-220 TaxID=454133 RepID=UPI00096141CF|nr:DUF4870 domain-containing protein [[Limnothrix rosea] IAM M-220]OKH15232.1 hypothetical protein NIES208_12735 [[Limnothrix rosea] IAM M-220]